MSRGYDDNILDILIIYSRLEALCEAATLRAVRRGAHEVEGCSSVVLLCGVYCIKDMSGGAIWRYFMEDFGNLASASVPRKIDLYYTYSTVLDFWRTT